MMMMSFLRPFVVAGVRSCHVRPTYVTVASAALVATTRAAGVGGPFSDFDDVLNDDTAPISDVDDIDSLFALPAVTIPDAPVIATHALFQPETSRVAEVEGLMWDDGDGDAGASISPVKPLGFMKPCAEPRRLPQNVERETRLAVRSMMMYEHANALRARDAAQLSAAAAAVSRAGSAATRHL